MTRISSNAVSGPGTVGIIVKPPIMGLLLAGILD